MTAPQHDILAEGVRLVTRANEEEVPLRLFGGVAIRLRAGDRYPASLAREYGDLDLITSRDAASAAEAFVTGEGYLPDTEFNLIQGHRRMLFYERESNRHLDIFVEPFAMCHEIPVNGRLQLHPHTIPLAELLLTKLQIVQLNEKDVGDALALIISHEVGEDDGDALNAARVAELCASDWGLWRTITGNLDACLHHVERFTLSPDEHSFAHRRIGELLDRIEAEPKSRRWRLRARVGERVRWYELPEEVGEGA
jgi:hypothetical protein